MGSIPPPPPIFPDEFRKRYRPGMSMEELDPEFCKWLRGNESYAKFVMVSFVIAVTAVLATVLFYAIRSL